MSIYNPDDLPFWEKNRGKGPIIRQQEIVEKHRKRYSDIVRRNGRGSTVSTRVLYDIGFSFGDLGNGNRWISARR